MDFGGIIEWYFILKVFGAGFGIGAASVALIFYILIKRT